MTLVSGSGSTQTFTAAYSDTVLVSSLVNLRILFNFDVVGTNACYAEYNLTSNELFLVNNANDGLIGPLTPGSSSALSNSQCTLNEAGSSVSIDHNTLTVNFSITFNSSFAGLQNIYPAAYSANKTSGSGQEGSNIVSFGPASVDPVSPSSGYGSSKTFAATYSDSAGISNITSARILFNTSVNGVNACCAFTIRKAIYYIFRITRITG